MEALQAEQAEALAAANRAAQARLEEAQALAGSLQTELVNRNRELEKERRNVDRRIREVSEAARRDCASLSADWVRLYNEAFGYGGGAGSEAEHAGGAADKAPAAGAPGNGVRANALATPEDVLAHVRDYGRYCRGLEAAFGALCDYERGRP